MFTIIRKMKTLDFVSIMAHLYKAVETRLCGEGFPHFTKTNARTSQESVFNRIVENFIYFFTFSCRKVDSLNMFLSTVYYANLL